MPTPVSSAVLRIVHPAEPAEERSATHNGAENLKRRRQSAGASPIVVAELTFPVKGAAIADIVAKFAIINHPGSSFSSPTEPRMGWLSQE